MAGNIFGQIFRLITFGESHGTAIGGVVEGCPAGLVIDEVFIQKEMERRRPGAGGTSSERNEKDQVEILSGVHKGRSLGSPIAFIIRNEAHRPADYKALQELYRPSHADFTTVMKYGIRDADGGGRSSGRETASRVAGGAIAKLLLKESGIDINAFTASIGPHRLTMRPEEYDPEQAVDSPLCCPDPELTMEMLAYLESIRAAGDSTGGTVLCSIRNVSPGLGEPVFDKLHADLGKAILGIGACKGFEIGSGFEAATMRGSEHNDAFIRKQGKIKTATNRSGGVQGGISNGMEIWFRAAFKPIASISRKQKTVDASGEEREISLSGRHDVCVLPRVIPVVEAMAALVLADHLLRNRSSRI